MSYFVPKHLKSLKSSIYKDIKTDYSSKSSHLRCFSPSKPIIIFIMSWCVYFPDWLLHFLSYKKSHKNILTVLRDKNLNKDKERSKCFSLEAEIVNFSQFTLKIVKNDPLHFHRTQGNIIRCFLLFNK